MRSRIPPESDRPHDVPPTGPAPEFPFPPAPVSPAPTPRTPTPNTPIPTAAPPARNPHIPSTSGVSTPLADTPATPRRLTDPPSRALRRAGLIFPALVVIALLALLAGRLWLRHAATAALPQIDGSLSLPGLSAPVTVRRDAQGVPHLHARTVDDLVLAQGFVTAQDRLFQMDALRRHASGTLAEVLGPSLLPSDRVQRILQIRAAADRAIDLLPPDQLHFLDLYARGVNASITLQEPHLPIEFRILRYNPQPWTPRDSLLVELAMFEDLTNSFPTKLNREALTARLAPDAPLDLRAELLDDLYPVGSWRDHPPTQPLTDLTLPVPEIDQTPLDNSQTRLTPPTLPQPTSPCLPHHQNCHSEQSEESPHSPLPLHPPLPLLVSRRHPERSEGPLYLPLPLPLHLPLPLQVSSRHPERSEGPTATPTDLLNLTALLQPTLCQDCRAGSNNWVAAGSRTATGAPLLSNDMHLSHNAPGIWYEADLDADSSPTGLPFHVAGVSLPGTPFVIVGHNAHVAWGFTNLGADVQDLYIEHLQSGSPTGGPASSRNLQFQTAAGTLEPVLHTAEIIHVRGSADVTLDVLSTLHHGLPTPIISPLFPSESRTLSLCWTIDDPANLTSPFFSINAATSSADLVQAFSTFGGPAQNLVYADDAGHIGYHALGRIPVRGNMALPAPLSPVPTDVASFSAPTHEWIGYIPYAQLPQATDPAGGILATANARITPDPYPFPITLNWGDPYRNQRIWRVLGSRHNLTPADMLALQGDIYSDPDRVIGQRLAYAIDNLSSSRVTPDARRLRQAADLLRSWNGNVDANSPAPAIVDAARAALWPMLLTPKLIPAAPATRPTSILRSPTAQVVTAQNPWQLYTWGERAYAEEQIVMHAPTRWLPSKYATWDEFLAAAVEQGLVAAHAPSNLTQWRYGKAHPVDIENPVFAQSTLLRRLLGFPTGTGEHPQSGDGTTVKQVGRTFGPSERFTADLSTPDNSTLNIVLGQSGDPASPWFLDQFPAWYTGTTYKLPFTAAAISAAATHTLTLTP